MNLEQEIKYRTDNQKDIFLKILKEIEKLEERLEKCEKLLEQ